MQKKDCTRTLRLCVFARNNYRIFKLAVILKRKPVGPETLFHNLGTLFRLFCTKICPEIVFFRSLFIDLSRWDVIINDTVCEKIRHCAEAGF